MNSSQEPYGLGVTLYSFFNRTEIDSPYYIIAKFILKNIDDIKDISIKELAARTAVSTATISRFCKEIGLQSFADLKEMINDSERVRIPKYDFLISSESKQWDSLPTQYLDSVIRDIKDLQANMNELKIRQLVKDIHRYENVVTFGAMHMESVAQLLQNHFFKLKKVIETRLDPRQQMEYIEKSNGDYLIIIFSISGNYLREYLSNQSSIYGQSRPKIYVITMNTEVEKLKYVDEVILLPKGSNTFSSHPLNSILLVNLITLLYAENYRK